MLQTAKALLDIQIVADLQRGEDAVTIRFRNGLTATLPLGHPDEELFLLQLESSLERQVPVGVRVGSDGRLLDLNMAHNSGVCYAKDDEDDANRVAVAFWGYSPICYLTRDHPEFARIKRTLDDAVATGNMVWLANESQMVESETEIWWKLMDVRPVQPREEAPKTAEVQGKNGP
jgi:hypothetical protein